ncbi:MULTISPECIES: beta-ketoacyl synthase N-terminal-like domain-containing protein [unclassified Serratia (in: enterobacteria)]|uniref:beta-ketoacyl synthase N-terminal-like domain-containing protein n=1 Tax=unclassified Serratia (in: enterobacteria) TaxID=2647522 RepID=UPI0030760DA3
MKQDNVVNESINDDNAIAIIGIACQFPGVKDFSALWSVLANGTETIQHFSDEELLAAGVRSDRLYAKNYIKSKGVLTDVEYFDHELFNIEPERAILMDPQHRVFIQKCWEALEDGGYDPHRYPGAIGLYAGCAINTYVLNNLRHADRSLSHRFNSIEYLVMTDKDFLSTQTSWLLGLTGPSMTVQTACSTSLSAIHLASESLLARESDMALAGAVTIYSPQVKGYLYEPDSIISPDGHVRSFDANGGGTVYSSGVGVILLKRLTDALRDNDNIHAVIRATAINNDGNRKALFRMPSAEGIEHVSSVALELSQIPVESIGMLEANGSGTLFGDPIEVAGLTAAYSRYQLKPQSIPLGSVKSNIGHMNVTAGMGAICKTVAALKEGQVPPSINYSTPNPGIDFSRSPFFVCDRLMPWPHRNGPRRAAVNIYGVGGTNAHAILEQAPESKSAEDHHQYHLLMLSAHSSRSLKENQQKLLNFIHNKTAHPGDVAFTLNQGRQQLRLRSYAIVGPDGKMSDFSTSHQLVEIATQGLNLVLVRDNTSVTKLVAFYKNNSVLRKKLDDYITQVPELHVALHANESSTKLDGYLPELLVLFNDACLAQYIIDSGIVVTDIHNTSPATLLLLNNILDVKDIVELFRIIHFYGGIDSQDKVLEWLKHSEIKISPRDFYSSALEKTICTGEKLTAAQIYQIMTSEYPNNNPDTYLYNKAPYTVVSSNNAYTFEIGLEDYYLNPEKAILELAAKLWLNGFNIDLKKWYYESPRKRISLPTYSFEKHRHWVDIPVETRSSNYDVAL